VAKVEINVKYNSNQEIHSILDMTEKYVNMKEDKTEAIDHVDLLLQQAFDDGRKFQKENSDIDS
jgi:hypothetical protein